MILRPLARSWEQAEERFLAPVTEEAPPAVRSSRSRQCPPQPPAAPPGPGRHMRGHPGSPGGGTGLSLPPTCCSMHPDCGPHAPQPHPTPTPAPTPQSSFPPVAITGPGQQHRSPSREQPGVRSLRPHPGPGQTLPSTQRLMPSLTEAPCSPHSPLTPPCPAACSHDGSSVTPSPPLGVQTDGRISALCGMDPSQTASQCPPLLPPQQVPRKAEPGRCPCACPDGSSR